MANTDPSSASVIPFEIPEQMRAFAEKGVSQARDSYAKFKDAAETQTAPSRLCSRPPARAPANIPPSSWKS